MKNWTKRKKIIALVCSAAVVCVLSVSAIAAAGVLSGQTKGAMGECSACGNAYKVDSYTGNDPGYCENCVDDSIVNAVL